MLKRKSTNGFTLLEVMIAVTVFAAIALTISETASQSISSILYLQDKTLASMVAENKMNELRLAGPAVVGEQKDSVAFAGRDWNLHIVVVKTDFLDVNNVTINVADSARKDSKLISLSTIMGRH